MQVNRTGGWIYVLWVAVALLATLFLNQLLRARVDKQLRYQQLRNGIVYVLLGILAVYAAYVATR
jgi:hypothetical protein